MDKHPVYARSRTPGRYDHPRPAHRNGSALAAARHVAARYVADHWPALANVEPEVTLHRDGQRPSPKLVARLGLDAAEIGRTQATRMYTFTFTGRCDTADGAMAPLVAAITVDGQQRIIKMSLSK